MISWSYCFFRCDNGIIVILENVLIIKKFTLKHSRVKYSVVCKLFSYRSDKKCVWDI